MFDLTSAKTSEFENLPDGKYTCFVTDAVMKDTKDGTGEYIKTTLTVKSGAYEGRKIFTNFNVKNKNEKAVEIGMGQIKSLFQNSDYKGELKFNNANEVPVALCGLCVGVKTKTKKDETYGDKVEVSYFFKPEATKAEEELGF